ncbi:MAG: class I SAM-dependent methyltransferase [Burkholderiales bacterium]|nr:class I SAM-dependent methyltransferase [Burkholderiales bacterium]
MNLQLLTSKLIHTFRTEGVPATCRRVIAHLGRKRPEEDFDRRHRTDTGGLEPLWKLSIRSPNAVFGERYQATGEEELLAALEFLGEDFRNFTFIDLGCGKGRTLMVAAKKGFRRVIGVEFAEELVEIATRNLARHQAPNVIVSHADAADFVFPEGNMVLYLYNPFSEEVLRKVISNLRATALNKLYLIYKTPRCADLLDASGFLKRFGQPPAAPQMAIWMGRAES